MKRLVGVVVVFALGFAFIHFLLNTEKAGTQDGHNRQCMSNLQALGMELMMFSQKKGGEFPDSLDDIVIDEQSKRGFICPLTDHQPGAVDDLSQWSDYVLLPGRKVLNEDKTVLAYCKPANHGNQGTYVLFVNGRVRWVDMVEFEKLVKKSDAGGETASRNPVPSRSPRPTSDASALPH